MPLLFLGKRTTIKDVQSPPIRVRLHVTCLTSKYNGIVKQETITRHISIYCRVIAF